MNKQIFSGVVAVICLGSVLLGCAETQLAITAAKRLQHIDSNSGIYKVGNPYRIKGVWYYPQADYNYAETGIASWYGAKFHMRKTANGETFDMNGVTAAHRTLPLPSVVRVTNLENGRSLVLKVNDRGPFAHGRIIDISRRGAKSLGFYGKGTARVRVEILPEASRRLAVLAQRKGATTNLAALKMPAVPQIPVQRTKLPGSIEPVNKRPRVSQPWEIRPASGRLLAVTEKDIVKPNGVVTIVPTKPTRIFIQAGAFKRLENASRLKFKLKQLAQASVKTAKIGSNRFYRVRLGPLDDVKDADAVLKRLISTGHTQAKIVVE